MKKYKNIVLSLIICFSAFSCSDFLDEKSQDEIRPSSVEDLIALMNSSAYPYQFRSDIYLNLLTDDYVSNGLKSINYTSYMENGSAIFQYQPTMFDGTLTFPETDANSWEIYYDKIKGCNVILDYIDRVSGSETDKSALRGQCLFLRAFYYMKLVMIYGRPYNETGIDPAQSLGVPLVLKMDVSDDYPSRNTLKECYDQIEFDFIKSDSLLAANYTPTTVFRVGTTAVEAMLSRFYLYRGADGDLQKIIASADNAIANGSSLTNLTTFQTSFGTNSIYDPNVSSEALWIYGSPERNIQTYYTISPVYGSILPYSINKELMSMYDANDLRAQSYFFGSYDYTAGSDYMIGSGKVGSGHSTYGARGIRIAEVYLNRAEAYARLFKEGGDNSYRVKALSDLNTLRKSRYATGTYENAEITDADSLIDFCLAERRRELSLEEGLRWFDIKRLGLSVIHVYVDSQGNSTTYTLSANDKLYALPIPYNAIQRNYKLQQNLR